MYEKNNWKARKGTNLNRFKKSQETALSVILENEPTSVTEPGTPFSTANMNKIEDGIFEAHEMIAREEQSRIEGDKETLETAKTYTDKAQLATQTWLPAVNTVSALDDITGLNNNINYLCRVIKNPDISKNGVYQCLAGWESKPIWTFFSDNADWIDENELAEAIETAIEEHDTNANAHESIQAAIADEATARIEAVNTEAAARDRAVTEEAQTRSAADNNLQGNIDDTNSNVQNLRYDFNAWIGRGGYLEAYDFGVYMPTQEQLTNQALAQISTIAEPSQIWNGTKIVNIANNYLWVLTNTPNTSPPIFEWTNQGTSDLTPFMEDRGGYIVGATQRDPPEFVRPTLDGKGKVDIDAITAAIISKVFLVSHPVGSIYMTVEASENTAAKMNAKYGGTWQVWAAGRVPVGVNSSGTFNTVEKTGGAETHTLDESQMPRHTHEQDAHSHNILYSGSSGSYARAVGGANSNSFTNILAATVATNQDTGGGQAHNNLQPYITCYMYKRIA